MKPMLASKGTEEDLTKRGYVYEPKIDGYRATCRKGTILTFTSRNNKPYTKEYPELQVAKNIKAKECLLDGEIVVYDEKGNPSFQLLQRKNRKEPVVYVVFDILEKEGKDLTKLTLEKRRKILEETIEENKHLQIIPQTEDGEKLWSLIKKRKLEGIIAKRKTSKYYYDKRSPDWKKIKFLHTQDCVILGYTTEKRAITSFALGAYHKNKLIFIGKVGTGLDEKFIKDLKPILEKLHINKKIDKGIQAIHPRIICEIEYLEVTEDLKLRAPVFIRLRDDKTKEECEI